jgi:hypothetical protein
MVSEKKQTPLTASLAFVSGNPNSWGTDLEHACQDGISNLFVPLVGGLILDIRRLSVPSAGTSLVGRQEGSITVGLPCLVLLWRNVVNR